MKPEPTPETKPALIAAHHIAELPDEEVVQLIAYLSASITKPSIGMDLISASRAGLQHGLELSREFHN